MEKRHLDEATMSGINQLIAPDEIKQEPDIKDEPMETDDLVEFPPIFNDGIGQLPGNPSQNNGEGDHANSPLNEVKVEAKPECVATKKKKKKGSNVKGNALKQHQCNQCGYMAKWKCLLEIHSLKHTGEKPFPCSHCTKEFTHKRSLQNHMKMHVEEFLFNCVVCLKGFDTKDEQLAHETECRIRRYECHLCKHSFGSNKVNLMNHIRVHSGAKPFKCKECSKKYARKSDLKKHMKQHAGLPSFHCSRCREGFVQQNEMVAHEQKCRRRMYECYVCGKFIGLDKGHLERHMRTHSGDKPFGCMMCQSKFTRKWNLTTHINNIHNKRR